MSVHAPVTFFDHTPDTLREWCVDAGRPKFLADQLVDWVYRKGVTSFDAMTNISAANRAWLTDALRMFDGRIVRQQSASDGTQKLLVGWPDDRAAPSALPVLGGGVPVGRIEIGADLAAALERIA